MTFKCTECKFAEWKRTKAGRRHPNGMGQCMWIRSCRVPASYRPFGYLSRRQDVVLHGGWICRKNGHKSPTRRCDVFQPIKKGQ